eukprot:SM000050S17043  [mRNA]  locus=s50:761397:765322:+ [translate_table: standard]
MALARPDLSARWVVLALTSAIMMGAYFCFDNPSALKEPIQRALDLSDTQYNLFYSVYSFPNIVLPLAGGMLVDRCGTRTSMLLFTLCIVLGLLLGTTLPQMTLRYVLAGQGIFAAGIYTRSYHLSLAGRFTYGLGAESLNVGQSTVLAVWFAGKEMALAMGLGLTVARMGSVINDWVCPAIFNYKHVPFFHQHEPSSAIWFGFMVTLMSLVCSISMLILENYADKYLARECALEPKRPLLTSEDDKVLISLLETPAEHKSTAVEDVKAFPFQLWLLTASCVIVYATVIPFNNVAAGVIMGKWGLSLQVADGLMSIPYLIAACVNPLFGSLVDKYGYRARLLFAGAFALCSVHLMLALTLITPYVPLITLGLAYSVFASAVWPSVALVAPVGTLGTAYGLTTAVQNAGLFSVPIAVGKIRDNTGSYKAYTLQLFQHLYFVNLNWLAAVELFFAGVDVIGMAIGVLINVVDARADNILNKPHSFADVMPTSDPGECGSEAASLC